MEATREIQWLQGLFTELNRPISRPITLYRDNNGVISTAKDPTHHNRTKHTLLRFNYLREQVREGLIEISYLETAKMAADRLTKALIAPKFKIFLDLLGLDILAD